MAEQCVIQSLSALGLDNYRFFVLCITGQADQELETHLPMNLRNVVFQAILVKYSISESANLPNR